MGGLALNFVHKRIGRAVTGFVAGGFNPLTAATAFLSSGGGSTAPTKAQRRAAAASPQQLAGVRFHLGEGHTAGTPGHAWMTPSLVAAAGGGGAVSLAPVSPSPCRWPSKVDPNTGQCRAFLGSEPGFDDPSTGPGNAVMGQYGAGLEPEAFPVITRRCIPGMVLGRDLICYNRRDIRNDERRWPRGRRPLLTGGDMRCISVASRAAKKLETKTKQLRKMGMLKALPKRARAPKRLAAGPGITVIDTE